MLECFYLRTAAQTNSGPINKIKTGNISICILSAGGASVSPLSHDKSDQTNSSLISRITGSDKNIDNPGSPWPAPSIWSSSIPDRKVVLDLPGGTIIDRLVPYPLLPTGLEFPGWLSDS